MAGDWIKMRSDLHTHPKVVRIASALKADRLRVIGALHATWCLFDVHSTDGLLDGYSPETLNDMIGFDGFAEAMITVEWLFFDGENLLIPRFDDHNGTSAKRRAQEANRKRSARKASASEADKNGTREEKRREDIKDIKDPPKPPKGERVPKIKFNPLDVDLPEWLPAELWASWGEFRKDNGKPIKTAGTVKLSLGNLEKFRASGHKPEDVINQSIANSWTGLFEVSADRSTAKNIDFEEAFNRLIGSRQKPKNEAEEMALKKYSKANLGRASDFIGRQAWRGYLKQAYEQTGVTPESTS